VLFLALVASAAAMVALSWAQSRMSATRAAVILTMEPAAAGVTAAVMGATLELRILLGGSLLIVAMLVVEIGSRKGKPFLVACDESSGAIRYESETSRIWNHHALHGVRDADLDATVDRNETRVGEGSH
jgi:hypothetical protein